MMSTRRTLLAGLLLPALVLFLLPAAASAQVEAGDIEDVTVHKNGLGKLLVTWSLKSDVTPEERATITGYEVRYEAVASGTDFPGLTDVRDKGLSVNARSHAIEGLKHGTRYIANVGAMIKDVALPIYGSTAAEQTTSPGVLPDKVDDVMVTPGDGMLMVEWEEGDGNGLDITGYKVQVKPAGKSYKDHYHEGTGTMTTISGLMNGTEYSVRVKATSSGGDSADWSDVVTETPMADATPTPALPLFGAIGLGAGLLAAGRTRLRRRRMQRQLTR